MANDLDLTLKITADSVEAQESLKLLNSKLEQTQSDIRAVAVESSDVGNSFEGFHKLLEESTIFNEGLVNTAEALGSVAGSLKELGFDFDVSIGKYKEFQAKITEVSTLLNDVSGLQTQTQAVKELATAFGQEAVVQASALYQTISAGVSNANDALNVLTVANKLAVGGVTDVATAVDGLTSILNAYAMDTVSTESISDSFFVTMKRGKTTIQELADNVGNIVGVAAQAGVSLDDLMASIATITLSGKSTSEAVTAMRGAITAIISPTKEASDLAAQLGLEFSATALASKPFADVLADIQDKTGGSTELLGQLFGNVKGMAGVMSLVGTNTATFNSVLGDLANKAGATDTAVSKMYYSLDIASKRLSTAWSDVQLTIGEDVAKFLTPMVSATANFILNNEGLVQSLVTLGSVFASTLAGISALALGYAGIVPTFYVLTETINRAASAKVAAKEATLALAAAEAAATVETEAGVFANTAIGAAVNQVTVARVAQQAATQNTMLAEGELNAALVASFTAQRTLMAAISGVTVAEKEWQLVSSSGTASAEAQAIATANLGLAKGQLIAAQQGLVAANATALAANEALTTAMTVEAVAVNVTNASVAALAVTKEADAIASTQAAASTTILGTAQGYLTAAYVSTTTAATSFGVALAAQTAGLRAFLASLMTLAGPLGWIAVGLGTAYAAFKLLVPSVDTTTKSLDELQKQSKKTTDTINEISYSATVEQLKGLQDELDRTTKTKANMQSFWGALFYGGEAITETDNKIKILNETIDTLKTRQQATGTETELLKQKIRDLGQAINEAEQSNRLWTTDEKTASIKAQKEELAKLNIELKNNTKQVENEATRLQRLSTEYTNAISLIEKRIETINDGNAVAKSQLDADTATIETLKKLNSVYENSSETLRLNAVEKKQLAQAADDVLNSSDQLLKAAQDELKAFNDLVAQSPDYIKTHQAEYNEKVKLVQIAGSKLEADRQAALQADIEKANADLAIKTYGDQSKSLDDLVNKYKQLIEAKKDTATTSIEEQSLLKQIADALSDQDKVVKANIETVNADIALRQSEIDIQKAQAKSTSDLSDDQAANRVQTEFDIESLGEKITAQEAQIEADKKAITVLKESMAAKGADTVAIQAQIDAKELDIVKTQTSINNDKASLEGKKQLSGAVEEETVKRKEMSEVIDRETNLIKKQTEIQVTAIDHQIESTKTTLDQAIASGDLNKIREAGGKLLEQTTAKNKLETDSLESQAEAKRQQAKLAYESADAKEKEARADGEYTAAEQAAVEAMRDGAIAADQEYQALAHDAESKAGNAKAAEDLMAKQNAVNEAVARGAQRSQEAADAAKKAGDAAIEQGKSLTEVENAANTAANSMGYVQKEVQSTKVTFENFGKSLGDLGGFTSKAEEEFQKLLKANANLINSYQSLDLAMGNTLVGYDFPTRDKLMMSLKEQAFQLALVEKKTSELNDSVDVLTESYQYGDISLEQYNSKLKALESNFSDLDGKSLDNLRSALEDVMNIKLDKLVEQLDGGSITTQEFTDRVNGLRGEYRNLGNERLKVLNDALQDAIDATKELEDSARSALESALASADEVLGTNTNIRRENMDWMQLEEELRQKIEAAQAAGNAKAAQDLQEAYRIQKQVHDKRIADYQAEAEASGESFKKIKAGSDDAGSSMGRFTDSVVISKEAVNSFAGSLGNDKGGMVGGLAAVGSSGLNATSGLNSFSEGASRAGAASDGFAARAAALGPVIDTTKDKADRLADSFAKVEDKVKGAALGRSPGGLREFNTRLGTTGELIDDNNLDDLSQGFVKLKSHVDHASDGSGMREFNDWLATVGKSADQLSASELVQLQNSFKNIKADTDSASKGGESFNKWLLSMGKDAANASNALAQGGLKSLESQYSKVKGAIDSVSFSSANIQYNSPSILTASTAGQLPQQPLQVQAQAQQPIRTIKLDLGSGKALHGDEQSVNFFLETLKQHGMVAQ